jgi:hypothetical protein
MYQNSLAALQHHIENAERRVAEQTVRVEEPAKQGPTATLVIAVQLLDTFQKNLDLSRSHLEEERKVARSIGLSQASRRARDSAGWHLTRRHYRN